MGKSWPSAHPLDGRTMFEFSMTASKSNSFEPGEKSSYIVRRLKQLAALATRLNRAG
jgi:hypothetical protein